MAPNFNSLQLTNTRLVSSWLHEIPSDAGGGSEATLIAPSVCSEVSTPRRRKDEDQAHPAKPQAPGPGPTPKQKSYPKPSPIRKQASGGPKPTPTSPAHLPIRPRQNPSPPPPPPPATTTAAKPSPPLPIRERITQNFLAHCLSCHPTTTRSSSSSPSPIINNNNTNTPNPPNPHQNTNPTAPCPRCRAARSFAHRTHHAPTFLTSHLLPISETLSFDECTAYLNQAIIARLAGVLARGGGGGGGDGGGNQARRGVGRTWPTLDDFDFVRGVAAERRVVFGGFLDARGRGVGLDWWGVVRDRV